MEDLEIKPQYGWVIDGKGIAHAYEHKELIVIFTGLPGVQGIELKWLLEDFGPESPNNNSLPIPD